MSTNDSKFSSFGYTHKILFYKNVEGIGWIHDYFYTTEDACDMHFQKLQNKSNYRCVEKVKLQ